jgi:hypothetical protein
MLIQSRVAPSILDPLSFYRMTKERPCDGWPRELPRSFLPYSSLYFIKRRRNDPATFESRLPDPLPPFEVARRNQRALLRRSGSQERCSAEAESKALNTKTSMRFPTVCAVFINATVDYSCYALLGAGCSLFTSLSPTLS